MLVGNKSDEESGKREVGEKTGQALQVKTYLAFIVLADKKDFECLHIFPMFNDTNKYKN